MELDKLAKDIVEAYKKEIGGDIAETLTYSIEDGSIIFNIADYWDNIEYGRKSGTFPNVNSLSKWVEKTFHKKDDSLTFLIGRSIKENGIAPRPFFTVSVEEIIDSHMDNIADEYTDTYMEDIDKQLMKITK